MGRMPTYMPTPQQMFVPMRTQSLPPLRSPQPLPFAAWALAADQQYHMPQGMPPWYPSMGMDTWGAGASPPMSPSVADIDLGSLDRDAMRRVIAEDGEASEACTPRCSQFAPARSPSSRYPQSLASDNPPRLSHFVPFPGRMASRPRTAGSTLSQFVPVEHSRSGSRSLE